MENHLETIKYPLNMHLFLGQPLCPPSHLVSLPLPGASVAPDQLGRGESAGGAGALRTSQCRHLQCLGLAVSILPWNISGEAGKKWEKTHGFSSEQEKTWEYHT